jgi:DNA-binding NtrC family response regulator
VDVRIIAATNKNLEEAVEDGTFRGDLYYRLNVFPIYMPPLRERKTDILLLADFFLEKYAQENNKDIRRFSTPAIDMLMAYHWPGNVRELENCIERAVLLCEEGVIHSYHLPPTLQTGAESGTLPALSLEEAVSQSGAGNAYRRPEKHARQHHPGRGHAEDNRAQIRLQSTKIRCKLQTLPLTPPVTPFWAHPCMVLSPTTRID